MADNMRVTPQNSRALAPLAPGSKQSKAIESLVVDENTYWTGKDYARAIENRNTYPRYYRISITNLKPLEDYLLFVKNERLDEDLFLEVDPGDVLEFYIAFGGEKGCDPEIPMEFQVYVYEYVTPDENSKPDLLLDDTLRWIPRSNDKTIGFKLSTREIRVRPWPWKQQVKFEVSLLNHTYLPIQGEVTSDPDEAGLKLGIERKKQMLREPIAPLREQPVLYNIVLEKPLEESVGLTLSATATIPALDSRVDLAEQSLQIVLVPFLKMWQDWVVIVVAGFLLMWGLSGMPPVIDATTEVTLKFDRPVDIADLKKLTVTLEPDRDVDRNAPDSLPKLTNTGLTPDPNHKEMVTYKFSSGWQWRNFRWTWNRYPLKLNLKPLEQSSRFDRIQSDYRQGDLQDARISTGFGVKPQKIGPVSVKYNAYKDATINIYSGNPVKAFSVMVEDGVKQIVNRKSNDGRGISIPITMTAASHDFRVTIFVNNKICYSQPVTLTEGHENNITQWNSNASFDPIPPKTNPSKTNPPKGEKNNDKPRITVGPGITSKPGSPNPGRENRETQPDPQIVKWCQQLDLSKEYAHALTEEQRKSDALKLHVTFDVQNEEDKTTGRLTVKPDHDCWIMVFDVSKPGVFKSVFVKSRDDRNDMHTLPYSQCRAFFVKKNVPFTDKQILQDERQTYVVLGRAGSDTETPSNDLITLLTKGQSSKLAIDGAEWNKK